MSGNDGRSSLAALGHLEKVELQAVWPNEASAFTPWLLQNAATLGEVLGMQLNLTAAEHAVGDFYLDLVGRDDITNEIVIVENQLTRSDHDHLGKLLTYAGGTDAVNVVWLAKHFRREHMAALEWLNRRTDENTRFFAVEIAVVRIGDSTPAPLFRIVVQPNDWGKHVKTTIPATSTKNALYGEFWTRFLQRIADQGLGWTTSTRSPQASWLGLPSWQGGIAYYCSFSKKGLLAELFFESGDRATNDARFTAAKQRQAELEAKFGSPLSFEPLAGRKGSRIGVYASGTLEQTDLWDAYVDWFIDAQSRLRAAIQAVGGLATLIGSKPSTGVPHQVTDGDL
jgi:hypothetical protein